MGYIADNQWGIWGSPKKKDILVAPYGQFSSNTDEGIPEVFIRFNNLINNLDLSVKHYENKEVNL